MSDSPEQVLADMRGDAAVMRRLGQDAIAATLEGYADRFAVANARFMTWISEADAVVRSDHQVPWFRSRFGGWERLGVARWSPRGRRERQYLEVIVPLRRNTHAIAEDARRAARAS